jgi:hypothetical protein
VNKKSSTEKDREILSSVKREMQEPRQTTSVREALAFEFETAPAAKVLTIHPTKA